MTLKNIRKISALVVCLTLAITTSSSFAQSSNVRERVFIDLNAEDLLVGETLQYSTFCLSNNTNRTSTLSKYLYVELIGEDGTVFKRKHELIDGMANGEFFVPSSIKTGQYYLVAYTRWMRNFNDISKTPLVFINPYKGHSNSLEEQPKISIDFSTTSGELVADAVNKVVFKIESNGNPLSRSGRVIGNEQKVADVSSDNSGLGVFQFTPEAGVNYQLLLENPEGGFDFYDLPQPVNNGIGLNITHTDDIIELLPVGNVMGGKVVIEHHGDVVFERVVQSSFAMKINRSDLPKDILRVAYKDVQGTQRFIAPLFNAKPDQKSVAKSLSTRSLETMPQNLPKGNYSVSIRKVFSGEPSKQHATYAREGLSLSNTPDFETLQQTAAFTQLEQKQLPDAITFLPEYRYELLSGKLNAEHDTVSVSEKNVFLSLTGQSTMNMALAKTDNQGRFLMEYKTVNTGASTPAHLTVAEYDKNYSFEVTDNFIENHQLTFKPIKIDTAQLEDIRQRSIISQLENAYFTPIIDSTGFENTVPPTFNNFNTSYEFDDYVRFRTLKQHFVEYIGVAGVRERKDSKRFVLHSLDEGVNLDGDPLVLLDGVPVNTEDILDFSPYRIKSLDVLNRRFYFGSLTSEGILSFKTIQGNLGGFEVKTNHLGFDLLAPQPIETTEVLTGQKSDREPDSRIQLLWTPNFKVEKEGVQQIQFNTSDIEGAFELTIEGFAEDGTPISIIKKFTVKDLKNERG